MLNAPSRFLTPPSIAELLEINPAKVITWIKAGDLPALDLASPGCQRPRYRVDRADLEIFLERKKNAIKPTPPSRKRKAKADGVIQYF